MADMTWATRAHPAAALPRRYKSSTGNVWKSVNVRTRMAFRLLFDTESNGFVINATKVHCIAGIDVDTEQRFDFKPDQIEDALNLLDKATALIGHNIQRHDIPLLTKLHGWDAKPDVTIRDTMICARVIYPNVKATDGDLIRIGQMPPGKDYAGKHTLGAWGYRLGCAKGDYAKVREAEALALGITDEFAIKEFVWGTWNAAMHAYMVQDCETNLELWKKLKVDAYSQDAIDLEHRAARVCDAINEAGVPFNVKKAGSLHADLIAKKELVEKRLSEEFGSWYAPISPTKAEFTPKRDNPKLGYVAGAPMTKLKVVTFNPGSRDNIIKVLLDKGWQPTKFTEGGKPQIDEETIDGIVQRFPEMNGLGEYLMLDKRISQLADGNQAWLKAVQEDGRIHGVLNPMGTITGRCSHFLPNLGQVPNMASPYGRECRDLFYAPDGYNFLGADMAGLELRGLAHYLTPLDGGQYMRAVLEGDPHWLTAQAMGLAAGPRDKHNPVHTIVREDGAKRGIYSVIYGAGPGKVGEIVYNCLNKARRENPEGKCLYEEFFGTGVVGEKRLKTVGAKILKGLLNGIDGYADLKAKLQLQVDKFGWVPGLDGRRIPTRSEHSALNFLIQSAGAVLCKRWAADTLDTLNKTFTLGKDFQLVLFVHDELQHLVREGIEAQVESIITGCARSAGESYNFRVPLEGTAKTGKTWATTH